MLRCYLLKSILVDLVNDILLIFMCLDIAVFVVGLWLEMIFIILGGKLVWKIIRMFSFIW